MQQGESSSQKPLPMVKETISLKSACHLCTTTFASIQKLKQHLQRKHNYSVTGRKEGNQRRRDERFEYVALKEGIPIRYECISCYDHFPTISELGVHFSIYHATNAPPDTPEYVDEVFMAQHAQDFNAMEDNEKWTLRSGKVVEDELHRYAETLKNEHIAHSFIIDPSDTSWLKLNIFTREELHEITTHRVKKLPALPLEFSNFLAKFRSTSLEDLRRALWQQQPFDVKFDRRTAFDCDWARNVIHNVILEIEAQQLSKDHLESWYTSHIWSALDRCFGNLDLVEVVRGESSSIASTSRKNSDRTSAALTNMKRQQMGHRADFLVRKIKTEYACGEASKEYDGEKGTKWMLERNLKMPKMLKDQFVQLSKLCGNDESMIRNLSTIGLLHYGLHTSMLVMDCPAGYISRVLPTPTVQIPTDVTKFSSLLNIIKMTWKAKTRIRDTIGTIESYSSQQVIDGDDEIDLITNIYRTPSPSPTQRKRLIIPACTTTPTKKPKN